MTTLFRSLRIRGYRIWWIGMTASNLGTWVQRIAQDWLVLTVLTNEDATAVAVNMVLNFLPPVALLPLTALVADRFDRKKTLLVTQSIQALLAIALAVLTLTGTIELWIVFGLSAALGITSAFDQPVRQTFVSELVPISSIGNAIALNQMSFNAGRLIGPGLGGLLVAVAGPGWGFVVNAVAFAGTIIALVIIPASARDIPVRLPTAGGVGKAFSFIRSRGDVAVIFVMMFFVGLFALNTPLYIATMTRIEFHVGANMLGYLTSAMAIGSLTGALMAARRGQPTLKHLTIASAGLGAAFLICAIAPALWFFGVALACLGMGVMTTTASANGLIQIATPPELRGRVIAIYLASLSVASAVGALIAGPIIDVFGPRWAMVAAGTASLIAVTIVLVWLAVARSFRVHWNRSLRWPLRFAPRPDPGT